MINFIKIYDSCKCFLENEKPEDSLWLYNCTKYRKYYRFRFDKKVKKKFQNKCQFDSEDLNMFKLLLEKEVYPYKYMDSCSKFKETPSPNKEGF